MQLCPVDMSIEIYAMQAQSPAQETASSMSPMVSNTARPATVSSDGQHMSNMSPPIQTDGGRDRDDSHSQPSPRATTLMTITTTTELNTTNTRTTTNSNTHVACLQQNGFVVVRSLLPSHLLLALQATSAYLTSKARQGEWPYVRTVPKQYPPWQSFRPGDNIWGVQHLLHPDMPVRDVYAEVYFCDEVLNIVKDLLGLSPIQSDDNEDDDTNNDNKNNNTTDDGNDEKLVMELFNLLVSPTNGKRFELAWHRDDIRPDLSLDEEGRQLAEKSPQYRQHHLGDHYNHSDSDGSSNGHSTGRHHHHQLHAQYNIALFDDDNSLIVVPGSHARVRTETERGADPYEPNLPGQLTVSLNAGDAVFYDSNILHRGVYGAIPGDGRTERGRMTLHGSVGLAGHGDERARQVLQHAIGDWVERVTFPALEGSKRRRADGMRDRLVAMGKGDGLGYSLEG